MPFIALATYATLPELADDDRLLIGALANLDAHAVAAVWDDDTVAWNEFDAVIIRSCWDYHLRADEFFAWIDRVTALGVPIRNPPAMLRWNSRKTYLHDLTIGGVRTVPTLWLLQDNPRRATASLEVTLADTGWEHAV